jgi:stress-induced morphogen
MDVFHTNNNFRGQSDVLRCPFKSGPHFVHSLTSASQFEITVVRSIFQALQPVLRHRQFKSKPAHLHSLTLRKFTFDSAVSVRFLKLFNLKAGTRMLQLVPAPMNNHVMCPASHFGWPNKRFKSFAALSGTACRSPLT